MLALGRAWGNRGLDLIGIVGAADLLALTVLLFRIALNTGTVVGSSRVRVQR
jgi:hypothetical protein